MRLVPTTLAALDAEDRSGEALSVQLGVGTPTDWPPPFNDAGTRKWMRGRLVERPDLARWTAYYIVADIDGVETVVGNCGFKGEPDAGGMVEVGYSIVPAYHRRGIGSAALSALLDLAFGDSASSASRRKRPSTSAIRADCSRSVVSASRANGTTTRTATSSSTKSDARRGWERELSAIPATCRRSPDFGHIPDTMGKN